MKFACKYHKGLKPLAIFLCIFALVMVVAAFNANSITEKVVFCFAGIVSMLFAVNVLFDHDYVVLMEDYLKVHFMSISFKWYYRNLEGASCYQNSYHNKPGSTDYANIKISRKPKGHIVMTLERPYDFIMELESYILKYRTSTKKNKIDFSSSIVYSKFVYLLFSIAFSVDGIILILSLIKPAPETIFIPIVVAIIGAFLAFSFSSHKVKATAAHLSIVLFLPIAIRRISWRDIVTVRYAKESDPIPWYQKKANCEGKTIFLELRSGGRCTLTVADCEKLLKVIKEQIYHKTP